MPLGDDVEKVISKLKLDQMANRLAKKRTKCNACEQRKKNLNKWGEKIGYK